AALGCALLLPAAPGQECPGPCRCLSLPEPGALLVDCSSRGLRSVPAVPRRARRLLLHNNSLASVPAGFLDGLPHLRHLQLADNPWRCDCGIRYLQLWLQDFSAPALAALRCASPAPLAAKPLAQLAGGDLRGCARLPPASCLQFFWRDLVLLAGAVITLLLAAWALKLSKRLVCRLTLSRRLRRSIPKTR
ncbi:GPIX protein, partial [Cercotrichas coryphoeus]|nr:GPIX protein [Cercotrichas coryphoeus]